MINRKCVAILLATVFGFCLLGGVIIIGRQTKEHLVCRLSDQEDRKAALVALLDRNNLVNLPEGFRFWGQDTNIEYFDAKDADGNKFVLIMVSYKVPKAGDNWVSFIFDNTGNCILWSKDRKAFLNGGLLDLNGDGYLEKIVNFVERDSQPKWPFFDRAQIFSIKAGKSEKLLDIIYNLELSPRGDRKNHFDFDVMPIAPGKPSRIRLHSFETNENIEFIWSPEQKLFFAEGRKTENWEILFPSERQEKIDFWTCPGHPEIQLNKEGTCPMCGMKLEPVYKEPAETPETAKPLNKDE